MGLHTYLTKTGVVPTQIMQILGHAGLRQIFANHADDRVTLQIDQDGLAEGLGVGSRRRTRARRAKNKFPDVPSEEGQILMNQGIFGTSEYYRDRRTKRKPSLAKKLMSRELGDDREYCTRAPSAISQVREYFRSTYVYQRRTDLIGFDTFFECRYHNTL